MLGTYKNQQGKQKGFNSKNWRYNEKKERKKIQWKKSCFQSWIFFQHLYSRILGKRNITSLPDSLILVVCPHLVAATLLFSITKGTQCTTPQWTPSRSQRRPSLLQGAQASGAKQEHNTDEGRGECNTLRSQRFIPIILSVSKTKPKLGIGAQSYNPDYSGRLVSLKAAWTIWQDQISK